MKQIKINLNDLVKAKLNEHGFKRLTEDYNFDIAYKPARVSLWHFKKQVDKDGYSTFKIHEFIRIFNPDLHLIEMNVVIVRRNDF